MAKPSRSSVRRQNLTAMQSLDFSKWKDQSDQFKKRHPPQAAAANWSFSSNSSISRKKFQGELSSVRTRGLSISQSKIGAQQYKGSATGADWTKTKPSIGQSRSE